MRYVKTYQTAFPNEVRTGFLNGSRVNLPPRQRLVDRLIEETRRSGGLQRLTVCVSPTGYGKTRTIAQWLGDGSDKSARVHWVHCAPESTALLWNTIAHELATLSDQRPLRTDSPQNEAMRFAQALTKPATLILDDYHFATTPDNDAALAQLISKSAHLTLVVIGRSVGLLNTTFISARTRVRLIDESDLAWPADETKALVASLGLPFNDRLKKALKKAEGWPLALRAALNLGSDVLYDESHASEWNPATPHTQTSFDPLINLNAFAANYLEFTSAQARQVIFATVQLNAISLNQLAEALELDPTTASITVRELLELGLLTATQTIDGTEYRCHRAVRAAVKKLAAEAVSPEQRARLLIGRAVQISASAPFTAFKPGSADGLGGFGLSHRI